MTRMSDAMRAAAETAPVQDVHVSTAAVERRVRRNRSVRTGANVLVGAGAIAVVVAGLAVGPGAFAPPADEAGTALGRNDGAPEPGPAVDALIAREPSGVVCGGDLGADNAPEEAITTGVSVREPANGEVAFEVVYNSLDGAAYTLSVPTAYVLWNDTVVGITHGEEGLDFTGDPEAAATSRVNVALVNCWDGAELPPGDYSIVSHTTAWAAEPATKEPGVDEPGVEEPGVEEPGVEEPGVEEPGVDEPADEPSVEVPAIEEPADERGADAPVIGVDPDVSVSSDVADDLGVTTAVAPFTVISGPIPVSVPGDPVDDPFGKYLGGGDQPAPVVPDGVLTADEARKAYEAALTKAPWGMAPGTQRVVMTYDGASGKDLWTQAYFGCIYAGGNGAFPQESSELDLVDVTGKLPAAINLSYGWVVDGNPEVSLTVTNSSPWVLPGYWSEPNPTLYLVKDGKVVAEAYPSSLNRTGARIAIDTALTIDPASGTAYLNPGGSLDGTYIWRDLNGCWSGDTPRDVAPGQYTVLSVQDVPVGQEQMYAFGAEVKPAQNGGLEWRETREYIESDGDAGSGSAETPASTSGAGTDAAIAPAPVTENWVSFQVWTSLGTVTVTN